MKYPDDINLFIDECKITSKQEHIPCPIDNTSSSEHIVQTIGNKKSKRASWSPASNQECGLPPTGKRMDSDHHSTNSNRVRMRTKTIRNYQLQQPHQISLVRPMSFNERYERISNQSLNRNESLSNQRHEPSVDNNDFINDMSNASSTVILTKPNTNTSLPLQRLNSTTNRIYLSPTRPLLSAYQQKDSDYKFLSPVLNTNTVSLSSPISSSTSSSSSSSLSPASFTCLKGHEESSPTSPIGSSLNQYTEFTSQTPSIDSSPDDSCHPTITTRSIMTMSISPNRHHNQTHSSMTNNTNGLKEQQDQTEPTIISGSCLKSHKNKTNRTKKSVHFDWHSPIEVQPTSTSNYHPSVTVTSSSLSTGNNDNDEQKKKNDGETVKEKERIETTRRTIMTTTPLTTHIIHRSFSLSPSPLSKEENNYNRRHRQVKKENVDELNCTTSRRFTFNSNISPTKKSNGMNNLNGNEMPLNSLLVKTPSFNSQTPIKKSPTTNSGFFNFINRSNNSNKSSSTHRKSKQYGNKRLSADIESLREEDIDKVTINRQNELQSTIDNNINSSNSSSTDTRCNRSSIIIKSDESDSLNNGLLFQPVQSIKKEPFYLSPPKSNDNESSIGTMMQTSTLIISTPPQYHYYLYPPSISKKNSTTNISMNSISTNSSSSSSAAYDLDDDTLSYSNYTKIQQLKPVILSDSVQNFWPPPPSPSTLNNDPEQTIMASTVEQNKQSQSNTLKNKFLSSNYYDDSLSMSNGNQTDVLPPPTSLRLNNKDEEVRSYSEQSSYSNGCLRIASDSSLEDTQASYSERLREKSRSINRPVAMNFNNYSLSRSRSKDALNKQSENFNSTNRNTLRPKSAGQVLLSPIRQEISNDFQSKRQFFENHTYTDYIPTSKTNIIYTNPPQRHVTKCSWNELSSRQPPPPPESMIRTTKYFDSLSNQVSLPPTIYRKPVRIVKAVQRSAPSPTINNFKNSFPIKMNLENQIHLSSQYMRNLFPIPDHLKRKYSKQNFDNIRPTEDLLFNLKKRLEIFKDNQQIINDEIEINTKLGNKLIKLIETKAELNEIEKLKLHINEIETITSVLLKLSCRLAKVENDLLTITDNNAHTKAGLLEQREKIQQKHDEAKFLKDGIDRRSRLVTNILRKYLSDEQFDEYDHFIRMKSTLLMDAKDIEENITFLQKQIQLFLNTSSISHFEHSSSTNVENLQTNYCKSISTTA